MTGPFKKRNVDTAKYRGKTIRTSGRRKPRISQGELLASRTVKKQIFDV